jgi:hypothetical protein
MKTTRRHRDVIRYPETISDATVKAEYFFNPKKNRVECIVVDGLVERMIDGNDIRTRVMNNMANTYRANGNRFKGTSRCDPADVFDETVGKTVAFDKAIKKRNEFIKKWMGEIQKTILNEVYRAEDILKKRAMV